MEVGVLQDGCTPRFLDSPGGSEPHVIPSTDHRWHVSGTSGIMEYVASEIGRLFTGKEADDGLSTTCGEKHSVTPENELADASPCQMLLRNIASFRRYCYIVPALLSGACQGTSSSLASCGCFCPDTWLLFELRQARATGNDRNPLTQQLIN